ncbi:MAG: division/cell wall cluster transcriptional repressor MraZ [Eubacteriales bacterium]|nr:division/cell wall cluster transcriptional repressor MraZ [Eubacteriales bacterium]
MFMGTYYNSIDAKKRMIVPAKHRERLGKTCVLTKSLDKCIDVYTMEDWEKQMEKIEVLPQSDPAVRAFIRHFCANATECDIDKQGRLLIPQELVDYAGIKKDLVTMGAMRKIEIWAKEVWSTPGNDSRLNSEDFAKALEKYNF